MLTSGSADFMVTTHLHTAFRLTGVDGYEPLSWRLVVDQPRCSMSDMWTNVPGKAACCSSLLPGIDMFQVDTYSRSISLAISLSMLTPQGMYILR